MQIFNKKNLGVLTVGIVVGVVICAGLDINRKANSADVQTNTLTNALASPAVDFSQAIEHVASKMGPTVVSIRTEKTEKPRLSRRSPMPGSPFEGDDLFNHFFEDFFGEIPEKEYHRSGLGSGVIIDAKGHILTNEHVIGDVDSITVTLPDGREFKGTLKGTDPRSDLAVVKINAPNLPVAPLGNSDDVKIGQWVVAIGNPFGNLLHNAEPTVTAGVISALHRTLPQTSRRDSDYTDLIQTDAAINPGNSGGPLVNLSGEVIGINVAIFSTSGGYQGIAFAIPINGARRIVDSLIQGKEISYGWIGVSVQNLDENLTKYFGLLSTDGVLVSKVLDEGPAKDAGMKDGDVILSVDGKSIKNVNALLKVIGNTDVGKSVPIQVWRDKKPVNLMAKTAKRPNFDETGAITENKDSDEAIQESNKWRGMTVENIPPMLAQRMGVADKSGVVISQVDDNSPAQEAGLHESDVITAINKKPVANVQDFKDAVKQAKGDSLLRTARGYIVLKEKSE